MFQALRRIFEYWFTPAEPRWLVTLIEAENNVHHELGVFQGTMEAALHWGQLSQAWLSVDRGEPIIAHVRIDPL